MKNEQKILGGTPPQTNIDFFVWGGVNKILGGQQMLVTFLGGSTNCLDNNLGGGQQNFEKHIFVGQTFQGVHNFGDFWGVPKMNVVRALWVSEEPLWYTQYSERDLEP